MNDLERIKYDIETLINSYNKDNNNYYSDSELTCIRLGLVKALQVITKYIKLQGDE